MPKNFHLVLKKGPGPGQAFSLEKDEITIGRDITCDISIIEQSLSRRHARLFLKDGEYILEDLQSTNGTFIRGQQVTTPQTLKPGMTFSLGQNIEFAFEEVRSQQEATAVFPKDVAQSLVLDERSAKVFISYSRENKSFVEKLHASLVGQGINTWVDWEGIPLTADWWAEIEDAIEGADGFIFVISPSSLASKVCKQELDTAIEHKKRLIPILHLDPEKGQTVPDQISSHNWVFMRNEDELRQMLPRLVESIHTDLGWVQQHTRLLTLAREWERREKNVSLLLQGDDLEQAENWLGQAGTNQPQPTALHMEFVQASRRNANRRQRRLMMATFAALAVTVILAIVAVVFAGVAGVESENAENQRATAEVAKVDALNQAATAEAAEEKALNQAMTAVAAEEDANKQRQKAEIAQADAELQAERAYAGEIGSQALVLLDFNPPLAALLALESLKISPDSQAAQIALGRLPGVYPPLVDGIRDPADDVSQIAWSRDNRLAVASEGETPLIYIWDLDTGDLVETLDWHESRISALSWRDDGLLASGSVDGQIFIWDLSDGVSVTELELTQGDVTGLDWSASGRLASTSADSSLVIWDMASATPAEFLVYDAALNAVAWSPIGGLVTAADNGDTVVWNTASWTVDIAYRDHRSGVLSVSIRDDGLVATGSRDGTVAVRSMFGASVRVLKGHTDYVNAVRWSDDGRLASASWDDRIIIWDLDTLTPERILLGHTGPVFAMDWGPGGLLASGVRFVLIWDLDQTPAMTRYVGHLDWVSDVVWTDDGRLVSASLDNSVIFWDDESDMPGNQIETFAQNLGFMDSGLMNTGYSLVNLDTGDEFFLNGDGMQLSPDSRYAAGPNPDEYSTLEIVDVEALISGNGDGSLGSIEMPGGESIESLAWSPDGSQIALGLADGSIYLFDMATGDLGDGLFEHSEAVVDLSWSENGLLASAGSDGRLLVWDTALLTVANEMFGEHDFGASLISWGPGRLLASADTKGKIVIWDIDQGIPKTQVLAPYEREIATVAWSPDGSKLAFGGSSYNVYVFNTFYMEEPCSWLVRNMLEDEWAEFFFDREYEPTCPNLP